VYVTAQWVLTTQEYRLKYKNFSYVVQTSLSYIHNGDLRIRTIAEEHLRDFFFGDEIVDTFKRTWKRHQGRLSASLPRGHRLASSVIDLGPLASMFIICELFLPFFLRSSLFSLFCILFLNCFTIVVFFVRSFVRSFFFLFIFYFLFLFFFFVVVVVVVVVVVC
jgi:hypothetical protein